MAKTASPVITGAINTTDPIVGSLAELQIGLAADPTKSLTVRAAVAGAVVVLGGLAGISTTEAQSLANELITFGTAAATLVSTAGVLVGYFRRRFAR